MSGPNAFSGEIPGFPLPSRPGREPDELLLDMILNRQTLPHDAPDQTHALAETLADLAGPAEPGELAGEAAARSAFARTASPVGVSPVARSTRRRTSWLSAPRSARIAAALLTAVVGLGSVAAAYADALPGPIQDFAHHAFGAPPARTAHDPKPEPGTHKPDDADKAKATSQQPAHPGKAKDHAKPKPPKPSKPPAPQAHAKTRPRHEHRRRSPLPRAPQARPRTGRATMPPDASALAGNDYQDRVLACALRGAAVNPCGPASAKRPRQQP